MSTPPTLLLADDSVTIQRVVTLSFADQAVRVVVARDGQDAINRMARDRPDLVLADTNMPCVDGYDLARWVRQQPHLSTVPVLLLAGATDPVDEQRLHDSGANGVLEKPFEPSHVISRVKELLGMKGPSPAPAGRLVTSADPAARRTPARTSPTPETSLPPSPAAVPAPVGAVQAAVGQTSPAVVTPDEDFRPDAPIDDLFEAFEARIGDHEAPSAGELLVRAEGMTPSGDSSPGPADALETEHDWFARRRGESEADPGPFVGEPAERRPAEPTTARPSGGTSVRLPWPQRPPADVFETLLAAEQGDPGATAASAGSVVLQAPAPEITDEMLDVLAERVGQKIQRPLLSGLRDIVVRTVQDSMATEARAAVAEAVQAAVDGSILGTLRGAVNEALRSALPAAIEQHVAGAVRESADRAIGGAVEQAVRDTMAAQMAGLVRETVEREMRDGVAPLVQQVIREQVEGALQQVVTDAVFAAVPPAVADAVRSEAAGQVREVVVETSERLVREEIARIRERRG